MMTIRVLVLGGSGFVGAALVSAAHSGGVAALGVHPEQAFHRVASRPA
jgi:nucleoside-diphosphate-sugar epimerase